MLLNWRDVFLCAFLAFVLLPAKSEAGDDCAAGEWRCGDRSCARAGATCDGALDCADGSDEALALCRGTKRPLFGLMLLCAQPWEPAHAAVCPEACRAWPQYCYYAIGAEHGAPGTCVLPPLPRLGAYSFTDVVQRADRGPADFTLTFTCGPGYRLLGEHPRCVSGRWTAKPPVCISVTSPASSAVYAGDSNAPACSEQQFTCADGACVSRDRRCDGAPDCADRSDEDACADSSPSSRQACVLPEHPEHGSYVVVNIPNARPGQVFQALHLTVTCHAGYEVLGDNFTICHFGYWIIAMPQCVRYCKLSPHPSVTYFCSVSNDKRLCRESEPSGTVALPECNQPNYSHRGVLRTMRCVDGSWDYVAICQPECGTVVTPFRKPFYINGLSVHAEIPWHADIYDKRRSIYMQICGGSLVTNTVVISAANCFCSVEDSSLIPPSHFAVAVGKIYRPWNTQSNAHKSEVREVKIPPRFRGMVTQFRDDIALVILTTPVEFTSFVRPVCLDFDVNFETRQLKRGNSGLVAGWGLISDDGPPSQVLKIMELPYVDVATCMAGLPSAFLPFITSDKFCTRNINGTVAVCRGDSGGGLAFPVLESGKQRYYLRGVISTAAAESDTGDICTTKTYITCTRILLYADFIKGYLP